MVDNSQVRQNPLRVVAYREEAVGKTFEGSKIKYIWRIITETEQRHEIVFTSTKVTGKRRIMVDGHLQHEQQVFQAKNFMYNWPLGDHLFTVLPNPDVTEGAPPFTLTIDGSSWLHYRQASRGEVNRSSQQQRSSQNASASNQQQAQMQQQQITRC